MKIRRDELLKHLTEAVSPRTKSDGVFSKSSVLESLQPHILKNTEQSKKFNDVRQKLQESAIKNPAKGIVSPTLESVTKVWQPKTNVTNIVKRVLVEAALDARENPNAFRLDLKSIVMDKCHAKFSLKRANQVAVCELLYPNANDKITIKVSADGFDDVLEEIGLEDEQYVNNFGDYILQMVDESILGDVQSKQIGRNAPQRTQLMVGNKSGGLTGYPTTWETGSDLWESDMNTFANLMPIVEEVEDDFYEPISFSTPQNNFTKSKKSKEPAWVMESFPSSDMHSDIKQFKDLMKLMEAGAPLGPADVNANDSEDDVSMAGEGPADPGLDAGGGMDDVFGDTFGADDFSMDNGANADVGDFSADFGGGFGGGGEAGGLDAGGINADEGGLAEGDEEEEFLNFSDKTDWLNSSLDTMQKLTSNSVAQQMQKGSGVILTSDEILSGTQGIKNDMPGDIVNKFLKVYPELDTELTVTQLDEIEEKLSLDDGQFDSWLQQKLPEFTGTQEVDDTLNNEMFMPFEPMGGEAEMGGEVEMGGEPFDDGMGDEFGAVPEESEFNDLLDDFSEESSTPEYMQAEKDVVGPELNEFPNVDEGAPIENKPPRR